MYVFGGRYVKMFVCVVACEFIVGMYKSSFPRWPVLIVLHSHPLHDLLCCL